MAIKQALFKIKGMQRDLSESIFNSDFAFENLNIRLTAREDNTLISATNEKGNRPILIKDHEGNSITISGVFLGHSILNSTLVLFTKDGDLDYIYKLQLDGEDLKGNYIYRGNLNFSTKNPIETIPFYENENILKVYWLDGINQPRVINIADGVIYDNDDAFNFTQSLKLGEEVNISRDSKGSGIFPSGKIQYAFTYYNLYGLESNIFYSSPLYNTSYSDRGGSPEASLSNSFNISISNVDTKFDYIRIYSILRTTIDALVTVKLLTDIPVSEPVIYVDNGTTGSVVDPTLLLFIGGEDIIALTFTHKDNTLFLGNLKLNRKVISTTVKDAIKGSTPIFSVKENIGKVTNDKGFYPYINSLQFNSQLNTTFKYKEWYRVGFQALHKTGKWSEAVWINDVLNNLKPGSTNEFDLTKIQLNIPVGILSELYNDGYVNVRGVIVFPDINDREVIALGILNPTMYNVLDRNSNSPFAISSWFMRPNLQYDITQSTWTFPTPKEISSKAVTTNDVENGVDNILKGSWLEFRHNYSLPNSGKRNAEILITAELLLNPYVTVLNSELNTWITKYADLFHVDLSILTFHSPEIEFDTNVKSADLENIKMRIVGVVPITSSSADIDITTLSGPVGMNQVGFYKESIRTDNKSPFAGRALASFPSWFDQITKLTDDVSWLDNYSQSYVVYPWHANRALNNSAGDEKSAVLDKKKLSNLRYSFNTHYLNDIWEALRTDGTHNGITNVAIFDSNEIVNTRLKAPTNSGLSDINYYGNYDKVLSYSRLLFANQKDNIWKNDALMKSEYSGFRLVISGEAELSSNIYGHNMVNQNYSYLVEKVYSDNIKDLYTERNRGTEPVRMKFKSTPHAVFGFNYTNAGNQLILPTHTDQGIPANRVTSSGRPFWGTRNLSVQLDILNLPTEAKDYMYLWLAELYNDNVVNRFGGLTDEAFENNIWLPSGNAVSIRDASGTEFNNVVLEWTEGDTYYQRYDCLKTYPFTQEDQNQVIDILSFMCETHINIDGRYDRNRGLLSNINMSPTNFNLINKVYSLKNNYFNYRALNSNRFNLDTFPNTITWTKTKVLGADVDEWTNLTLASTLDLDGDKGLINSLNTFNDNIIGFQDKGIFHVLFNSRSQIPVSDGVPIEIANSGKVEGKRYISSEFGTTNKWSIVESPSGIYFMDNLTKGIYLYNGGFDNITDKLGFHSWMISNSNNLDPWNPVDFNNFTASYDKKHKDVYFTNSQTTLNFSELLGLFTSFYDYGSTPIMVNLDNKFLALKDSTIWALNEGDYNMFYGQFKPHYTTVVVNPDMPFDKIFNVVEFRADMFDNTTLTKHTLDNLKVWNEYLEGESDLINIMNVPSNLKEKFRIRRANIPRDKVNKLNRIRNPWIYLRLGSFKENRYRSVLHDMVVHYTI